eukprot:300561-Prymnesium_polylepis.1
MSRAVSRTLHRSHMVSLRFSCTLAHVSRLSHGCFTLSRSVSRLIHIVNLCNKPVAYRSGRGRARPRESGGGAGAGR